MKTTACREQQESVCHCSWMFRYVPNQGMQRFCSLIPSSKRFRRSWKSLRIQGLWSVAGAPNASASAADSPPMTGSSAFMCISRSLWRPLAPSAGVPTPAFTHHVCSPSLQPFRKNAISEVLMSKCDSITGVTGCCIPFQGPTIVGSFSACISRQAMYSHVPFCHTSLC